MFPAIKVFFVELLTNLQFIGGISSLENHW